MLRESEGYKGYSYKTHLNSNTDSGILYGYKQIGITTQLLNMSHNCSLEEFNFELASLWRCDAYIILDFLECIIQPLLKAFLGVFLNYLLDFVLNWQAICSNNPIVEIRFDCVIIPLGLAGSNEVWLLA